MPLSYFTKIITKAFLLIALLIVTVSGYSGSMETLQALKNAYPDKIEAVSSRYIAWKDGTKTPILSNYGIVNWFAKIFYQLDFSQDTITQYDIEHHIYEPVFRKIYGNTAAAVKNNLATIYWMPKIFGKRYPLKVTRINGVDKKLQSISAELEKLPPTYFKYLANPASNFYWRKVAGQEYLSLHSFGIAIDINVQHSNYWLWDFLKLKKPISALRDHKITYQNKIPPEIVKIFAKHDFYWGGNWYYYDTMHFEYRPELFDNHLKIKA